MPSFIRRDYYASAFAFAALRLLLPLSPLFHDTPDEVFRRRHVVDAFDFFS